MRHSASLPGSLSHSNIKINYVYLSPPESAPATLTSIVVAILMPFGLHGDQHDLVFPDHPVAEARQILHKSKIIYKYSYRTLLQVREIGRQMWA